MQQEYNQFHDEAPNEQEIPIQQQQVNKEPSVANQNKIPKKQQQQRRVVFESDDESSSSEEDDNKPILTKNKKKQGGIKAKSLQLQQMELEESNKKALAWAIRLRSWARILFLLIITTVLFTGFYMIFEFYAFYEGIHKIPQNARVTMNVTNCRIHVIDSSYIPSKTLSDLKYLGTGVSFKQKHYHFKDLNDTDVDSTKMNETLSSAENAVTPAFGIEYSIPGRFNIDPSANTSSYELEVSETNYSYEFTNILSSQSCEIDLLVYEKATLDDLTINCFGSCFIMMNSENITYNTLNITGELVELNAVQIKTKNITFNSIQGRFQGNYIDFEEYSDIRLESGDIAIQTDKELMVNWTHSNPHYCYSSPVIANPIVIGCQEAPESEVEAFISGVGTGKKKSKKQEETSKGGNKTKETKEKGEKSENEEEGDNDTDKLLADFEEYESFFKDEHEDLQGNIILIPLFGTYNNSKDYQTEIDDVVHQDEKKQDTKDGNKDGDTKSDKSKKANMQSKKKEQKEQQKILFQPSCYGNSVFCLTNQCSTLKNAIAKQNATKSSRILADTTQQENNVTSNATNGTNKTNTPIDYNGLRAEAQKKLPHQIPKGVRFLNVTGRFGNVYVNLIKEKYEIVQHNATVINGISYASGNIDFDLPSRKILKRYLKMADDPHNFDPTFILSLGSKITRSDNFQQWDLTYNPAYSYVRPWWMGTFSFTLMSTATWNLDLNLGPGSCPYHPTLNSEDIYNSRFLIGKYFPKAENAITTLAWQKSIQFPQDEYPKNANGLRQYVTSNDETERWVQIVKLNETSYQLTDIDLDQSQPTKWAVVVSVVISILTAFLLILGVLYMINSVYKQILEQVAATNKYSSIDKKNDAGADQPLMKLAIEKIDENQPKPKKSDKDKKGDVEQVEQSNSQDMEIVLNLNLGRLLYQLFILAPPLSAFIDYLCVLISKKYINSAEEFYTHLFQKKQKQGQDAELHDLTTESIIGNEMKTLYEKFCFLNGFLEQKLDDEKNLKILKLRGFKVQVKEDAQTESFVRVLLNGLMPKLSSIPSDKDPLALFIENCCKTTNFEEDNVVVQQFNEQFQEFCVLNHIPYETPSASLLQKNYNITSKYIAQQWVERDEETQQLDQNDNPSFLIKIQNCLTDCIKKCLPESQTFIINRQKMQNHYSLILNNPEKIKTQAELAEANRELILFGGWWMVDFFTVVAHFLTTIILIIPLFSFTLLEKILYAQFSLIPIQYIITLEDLISNYWIIPIKLYNESTWIKEVLILVGIYWAYSIIDLLYYYVSMEFPQENFFRKVSPKTANRIQLIFRQIMWGLVLYSAYQLCVFITLALVWLLLGAIVNPTAFLPYATAAATFVTVISTKAAQFKEIAQDGFETVIKYVENIAKDQMGNMIAKMDLKGKMHSMMDSDAFKSVAGQAASLGLVDSSTLAHIEENADAMLSDPNKAIEAAQGAANELQEIASNPAAFVAKMMKELEEKALQLIKEQMSKQIDGYGEQLAGVVLAIFKKDKVMFKNNLTQLMYAAANVTKIQALQKMGQPIMTFIWEFAYGNDASKLTENYIDQIIGPCSECISQLISQEMSTLFQEENVFEPRILSLILKKSISLQKNLKEEKMQAIFSDIEDIIKHLKDEKQFTQIQYLAKYSGLLKIAMSLFENKSGEMTFHKIFGIITGFFDEIPQLNEIKDLLGLIELLVNSFNKQHKALPTKLVRQRVTKGLNVITNLISNKNQKKGKADFFLENPAFLTLVFNFMQHNFEKIPKEIIRDLFKFLFEQNDDKQIKGLKELVQSEKEFKKLIPLMGGMFEMVALFMEDTRELTQQLHQQATAFSIPDVKKASAIQSVAQIKYLRLTTYEGSETEDRLFERLNSNSLIQHIANQLRLDSKSILAVVAILMQFYSRQTLQDLYQQIGRINKVDPKKVHQFFQLLILFKCDNATHIINACNSLFIPRNYVILILLSKQILDIKYIDIQSLADLGATEDTLKQLRKSDFELKTFIQSLKQDVVNKEDNLVPGGNSKKLKGFLIDTINDTAFQINQIKLTELFFIIGNNLNEFAKLTQNEIELATQILQLKNIDLFPAPQSLTSDTKQAIYTFAQILNVNKLYFEDLINIIFLGNSDRVLQSIKRLQPKLDEKNKEEYIPEEFIKEYESYLEFMFSKMEIIQRKQQFIYSKFQTLFPMIRLPLTLIEKLLFNKEKNMDMNAFYQLAYTIIEKNQDGSLPKDTLKQLNKSVSFLTSTINTQDKKALQQTFNTENNTLSDGQSLLIQMLNENQKQRSLSLLMNFLMSRSKRSKNDNVRPLPQVYHVFICLYLYFTGQWQELQLQVEDPTNPNIKRETNILNYLSQKLDIKQEFFEALHTFFLNDNQKFTQTMIKFMRRQQACKFEQANPGIKIPLQSLVKLPDQFVLNFINLITGTGYQTSFFAKELQIDSNLVLFISTLTNIKNAKSKTQRISNYQYLSSTSQKLGPLLEKVQILGDDFVLLLQLMYQDYDLQKIQTILNGLKLDQKVKVSGLQNLLSLDRVFDGTEKQWFKSFSSSLETNQLLKDMKVDSNMAILAKGLCRGKFGGLEQLIKKFQHFNYPPGEGRNEYIGLLQGLIGSISAPLPEQMNIKAFLAKLHKLLDENGKDAPPELQSTSCNYEAAIYQLVQIVQMDPIMFMLCQGVIPAWKYLSEVYYKFYNEENKWLNPILVLQTILTFQAIPTLIKEIISEYEWYQQMDQTMDEVTYTQVDKPEELNEFPQLSFRPEWVNETGQTIEQIKRKLFTDSIDTFQELQDMSDACVFNPQIIQMLEIKSDFDIQNPLLDVLADSVQAYAMKGLSGDEDVEADLIEIANLIRNTPPTAHGLNKITFEEAVDLLKSDQDDAQRLKAYKPLILYQQMLEVYNEILKLFVDPRPLKKSTIGSDAWFMKQIQNEEVPIFTMGICTTLSILRNSYWNPIGNIQQNDEEHYKQNAHFVDFTLTSIERMYFFKSFTDYFSKFKAAQLIGLSCGFLFSAEHFILANCTTGLTTQENAIQFKNAKNDVEKTILKWSFLKKIIEQKEEYIGQKHRFFKNFNFNKIIKYEADIITEPENYLGYSIQSIDINQDDQKILWDDYFYDIPYLQQGSQYNKFIRSDDQNNLNHYLVVKNALLKEKLKKYRSLDIEKSLQYMIGVWNKQKGQLIDQKSNSSKQPQQEDAIFEILDCKTNQKWSQVIKSQEAWWHACYTYNDNMRLLIDIWKGNYASIIEPDTYFTDEEPQAAQAYYGIAALSGSAYKIKNGWTQNSVSQISQYLNACCWNTTSNKKNLQEILSIYLKQFEGLTVLSQTLGQDQQLVNSFVNLSMNLSTNDQEKQNHQENLIKSMQLSSNDTEVLNSLLNAYQGDMEIYETMIDYSLVVNPQLVKNFKLVQMTDLIKKKRNQVQNIKKEEIQEQKQQDTQEKEVPQKVEPPKQQAPAQQNAQQPPNLGKAESKPGEEKKGKQKQSKKQNKKLEFSNSSDRYFQLKILISKLLYGFDQSQLHSLEKIDPIRFDFSNYLALSQDPNNNQKSFRLLLWQLAQAITKETLPDDLKLPILTESEISQTSTKIAMEYDEKLGTIDLLTNFLVQVSNDDYSFFFRADNEAVHVLESLVLVNTDKDEVKIQELNFMRAMIGLKSNKMMSIQNKARQKTTQKDVKVDTAAQVDYLVKSGVVDIKLDDKSDDQNKEISENIAKLFLSISRGNIQGIFQSILPHDPMSACFVLSMFMWKNITTVISTEIFHEQKYMSVIFPPLQLIPLLIYSQINEQQDKKNNSAKNNKRTKVINSFEATIKHIKDHQKKNDSIYQKIEQATKQEKVKFSWSQWLIHMPNFLNSLKNTSNVIKFDAQSECEILFKIMTGFYLFEKAQNVNFIGPILNLYKTCNQIINFPQTLQVKDPNFKTMIPPSISTLNNLVPERQRTYLGVFDKFVQLFVFIQIPQNSLKIIKNQNSSKNDPLQQSNIQLQHQSKQQSQNQSEIQRDDENEDNYEDRDDDYYEDDEEDYEEYDQEEEDEEDEEDDSEEEEEDQKIGKGSPQENQGDNDLAQINQTINEFILDVLGQTVNSLWNSFKDESKDQLNKNIINLKQAIENMRIKNLQSQKGTKPKIGQASPVLLPPANNQQGGINQQKIEQQPQLQQIGNAIPQQLSTAQQNNVSEKEQQLKDLEEQLKKLDEEQLFVKKLISGIILLLTGYNIDDSTAQNDNEQKMKVMYFIVDQVLFKNLNLLKYINTVVIRELFQEIQDLSNCSLKSITNQDFLLQIESLLYTLTGQKPTAEILEKKKQNQIVAQSTSKSDPWSVTLPKREQIVELPMGIIKCIFGLASNNFSNVTNLLKELKVSESAIKIIEQVIQQVQEMGVFGGNKMSISMGKEDPKKAKEIQDLMKKIQEGTATNADMFKAIDEDGTNSISKSEYSTLAKRLGMNLSEHRVNEIFANIKKGKSGNQDQLDSKEFDQAMKYLQNKNTDMALDFLGISPALLTILLIQGGVILLLIFIFIFLGIQAFALGGTFGAVVNSILPMAAGGGAGSKVEKVSEKKGDEDQIGDSVEKTQKIIQSDKI